MVAASFYGADTTRSPLPLTALDVYDRELAVLGSFGASGDAWPRAIELMAAGRIDAPGLVDAEWPLERAGQGLEELERESRLSKALISVAGP